MELREISLDRLNDTNISKSDSCYLHYASFHKDLKEVISIYSKGKVLDIGCGNKPYESEFNGLIENYIGCDIIQSNQNKVDILCPANKIPLENETFDTVFSTQTIEHVEDHQGLLNEAFRVLKKEGFIIVSGPMYWPLHEEPYDFFRFTKHGFKYILEKAGFEIIEIISNGGVWALAGQSLIHAIFNTDSNNLIFKIFRSAFYRLKMVYIINSLFSYLDSKFYNEVSTMNYVVVAIKK